MRCATYARKSNDDSNRDKKNKSVTRQIEQVKDYANKKGWSVLEDHIYVDDGISGAEYVNRPSFLRMLNNLKSFDAIIMSEASRLGRDTIRNSYHTMDILDSGVRIFYYMSDEEEKNDTNEQKLMTVLKGYASAVERQKASERSRDALVRKAKLGYNTGGRVYGYDNIEIQSGLKDENGQGLKSHTEYRVNKEQAGFIVGMFKMYADGYGFVKIAKTLNGEKIYKNASELYFNGITPTPPRKGSGSWAHTAVRGILKNERYRGIIPFGKHKKAYKGGTKVRIKQDEYIKTKREEFRIIGEELWLRVQLRLKVVGEFYRKSLKIDQRSKPLTGRVSKYLLSGLGQCDCCGGAITIRTGKYGSVKKRYNVPLYHCSYNYKRGGVVCDNKIKQKALDIDEQFLTAIENQFLNADAMDYLCKKSFEKFKNKLNEKVVVDKGLIKSHKKELENLKKELKNFEKFIAEGNTSPEIMKWIEERADKIKVVTTVIEELESGPQVVDINFARLEKEALALIKERVYDLKGVMRRNVPTARKALEKLVDGRVIFIRDKQGGLPTYRLKVNLKVGETLNIPSFSNIGVPKGIRTPVARMKTECP